MGGRKDDFAVIHYALVCDNDHKFEAWFRNAEAYDEQHKRGIVSCPVCMSGVVDKALMAPAVSRANSEKVSLRTLLVLMFTTLRLTFSYTATFTRSSGVSCTSGGGAGRREATAAGLARSWAASGVNNSGMVNRADNSAPAQADSRQRAITGNAARKTDWITVPCP